MPAKAELRRSHGKIGLRGRHAGEPLAFADRLGQLGSLLAAQSGFMVEQIQLRRTARLKQIDDALGFGREMRQPRQARVRGLAGGRAGCVCVSVEQGRQSRRSDAGAGQTEEMAAGESKLMFEPGVHGVAPGAL